ncbi:MAG: hypothetical protein ABIP75_05940 [Pyrinomonadaceae bacterium]
MVKIEELRLFGIADEYFQQYLDDGGSLSKILARSLPLESGSISALLPEGFDQSAVHSLDTGGIIPVPDEVMAKESRRLESGGIMVPKLDTREELEIIVRKFLQENKDGIVVFEDQTSEPTDPWLKNSGTRIFSYDQEVFHYLVPKDCDFPERINKTISAAGGWRFVGTLVLKDEISSKLQTTSAIATREDLERIAASISAVVVGAFDGESFLIWRPQLR